MTFIRHLLWWQAPGEHKIPLDAAKAKRGTHHRAMLYEKFYAAFAQGTKEPTESAKIKVFSSVWDILFSQANTVDDFLTNFSERLQTIDFSSVQHQPEVIEMLKQLGVLYRLAYSCDLFESIQDKPVFADADEKQYSFTMQVVQKDLNAQVKKLAEDIETFCTEMVASEQLFKEKEAFLLSPRGRAGFAEKKRAWLLNCDQDDAVIERTLQRLTRDVSRFENEAKTMADFAVLHSKKEALYNELADLKNQSLARPPTDWIEKSVLTLEQCVPDYKKLDAMQFQFVNSYQQLTQQAVIVREKAREELVSLQTKAKPYFFTEKEIELAKSLSRPDGELLALESKIIKVACSQYYRYQGLYTYVLSDPAVEVWNPGVTAFVSELFNLWRVIDVEKIIRTTEKSMLVSEQTISQTVARSKDLLLKKLQVLHDFNLQIKHPQFSMFENEVLLQHINQWIQRIPSDLTKRVLKLKRTLQDDMQLLFSDREKRRLKLLARCEQQIKRLEKFESQKAIQLTQHRAAEEKMQIQITKHHQAAPEFDLPTPKPKIMLSVGMGLLGSGLVTSGILWALKVGLFALLVSQPLGWAIGLCGLGAVGLISAVGFGVQAYNRHKKNKLLQFRCWNLRMQRQLFLQNEALKQHVAEGMLNCSRTTRQIMMGCGILLTPDKTDASHLVACKLTGGVPPRHPLYFNKSTGHLFLQQRNGAQIEEVDQDSPKFFNLLDRIRPRA